MKQNDGLARLDRALGSWTVTGTHPYMPGQTLRGHVTFERIDDGAFVRMHAKVEHPDFPEGVAIFGSDGEDGTCGMLYFDTRGVSRRYEVELRDDGFTWSRESPKLAQRFRVTYGDGTMRGEGTMSKDGGSWGPDLSLSYERA